jgi:hypothetical protein
MVGVVRGVRAATRAWNDVTVNTPMRPRMLFVALDAQHRRV